MPLPLILGGLAAVAGAAGLEHLTKPKCDQSGSKG